MKSAEGHPLTIRHLKQGWLFNQSSVISYAQSLEQRNRSEWQVYDSPLDFGSLQAMRLSGLPHVKGASISPFSYFFIDVIPFQYDSFKDYIQHRLAARTGNAIGLELGGPASWLFRGFDKGFFRQTLGVTLKDFRNHRDPSGMLTILDEKRGHQLLEANLLDDDTPAKIHKALGGQRADFIVQRLLGAIGILSANPFFVARKLDQAYQLLNSGGIMFTQVPDLPERLIRNWAEHANEQGVSVILGSRPNPAMGLVVRLERHQSSPEHLPFLPAKDVLNMCKQQFSFNRKIDPQHLIYAMEW